MSGRSTGTATGRALAQLRATPSRFVAVTLAVLLGVGFVATIVVFTGTFSAGLRASVGAEYARGDVVVSDDTGAADDAERLATVTATPGVAAAALLDRVYAEFRAPAAQGFLRVNGFIEDDRLSWLDLQDGRAPVGPGEVLVDRVTADRTSLTVGDVVALTVPGHDDGTEVIEDRTADATVVGIADSSASALAGASLQAWGGPALSDALEPDRTGSRIVVAAVPGTDVGSLIATLQQELGPDAMVRTSAEEGDAAVASMSSDADAITTVLLGFAAVAAVAAAIVIANTFTILVTQRARAVALLRCVGATTTQVRRQVLAEAAVLGVIGSLAGVAVGIGLGALAARLFDLDAGGLAADPVALAAAFGGGVMLTIVAAAVPAGRAARIAPLAALRTVPDGADQRPRRIRSVLAGLLTLGGAALLGLGVATPSLLVALPGGMAAAIGLLLFTPWFLPPLLRLLGGVGRLVGTPGSLAVANSTRHPRRAAAAAVGLMLGVGLIVTLQVGAETARASMDRSLADRYPVDATLTALDPADPDLPADLAARVAAVPGVTDVVALPGTVGALAELPDQGEVTVLGADPAAVPSPLATDDGTLLVPDWLVDPLYGQLSAGQTVTLQTPDGSRSFTVAAAPVDALGATSITFVTTAAAVTALTGAAGADAAMAVWASIPELDDLDRATAALQELSVGEAGAGLLLGGGAPERAALHEALGQMLLLATGLLAVAVIIALVGIGNTLSLSVLERTRESALLRALGLRRGQLALMLLIEAVLLAVAGTVVGVLAGVGFGWAGVAASLGETGGELVLSMPWGQLAGVLGLAVLAGILAAVLPARRATRTAPVTALADLG
ncbi:FtsX-like permease family protein [Nakamurella leprariae]|uniref:FtsX-like permease family protein n=1 Tax=Nakamurella leprariae TaxID=2803911 RepID=A0A938YG72_9ACTN|nr:ABC transporter permease [Nakamurella leprariae]MBM9468936.1 FtsX-like permease family protein [Nakamurella leprariae]